MLGAIIGDISGSRFEFGSHKSKEFDLFDSSCRVTDDSVMTVAVGIACVESDIDDENSFKKILVKNMRLLGQHYITCGFGESFYNWLLDVKMGPYGSYGNGSAMRVSPVAWGAKSLGQAEKLASWSAEVTHNHPEGIKGAVATASAVYLAREGKSKEEIRKYITNNFYSLDFTIDSIRKDYSFDVSCQGSVPQALQCFFEGKDFEDTLRNAISLGGDCDTQAAIACAVAEAYFGIPDEIKNGAMPFIDDYLMKHILKYSAILYD